jgi:hypothetical protein
MFMWQQNMFWDDSSCCVQRKSEWEEFGFTEATSERWQATAIATGGGAGGEKIG